MKRIERCRWCGASLSGGWKTSYHDEKKCPVRKGEERKRMREDARRGRRNA